MRLLVCIAAFALPALSSGCSRSDTPTCGHDDVECYAESLVWLEVNESPVSTVAIDASFPDPSDDPNAPSLMLYPEYFSFDQAGESGLLQVAWNDPLAMRPGICIRICARGVCSGRNCSSSVPDGLVTGVWRTYLGYNALPPEMAYGVPNAQVLDVQVQPITMPDLQDPIAELQDLLGQGIGIDPPPAESGLLFGQPQEVATTLWNFGSDDDESGDEQTCPTTSCNAFGSDQCGPTAPEALPYMRVDISGGNSAFADENGNFVIPHGGSGDVTVNSPMTGRLSRIRQEKESPRRRSRRAQSSAGVSPSIPRFDVSQPRQKVSPSPVRSATPTT